MINRLTDYQFHPASIDQPCDCPACVVHRRKARNAEQSVAELCVTLEWYQQKERDLVAANERVIADSVKRFAAAQAERRRKEELAADAKRCFLAACLVFALSSWWGVILLGVKLGQWLLSL